MSEEMKEAAWVTEMRDHFVKHGFYRPDDVARLLGNPGDSAQLGADGRLVLAAAAQPERPDAAALVHAGIEHAESAGDIHASIPVWALRDLLARAAIEATTVKGDGLVERLDAFQVDARRAVNGDDTPDSFLSTNWQDKPHRVVFDACALMREAADTITTLKGALRKCRDKFAEYVELHRSKLDSETGQMDASAISRKVARNQEMVDLCDQALGSR